MWLHLLQTVKYLRLTRLVCSRCVESLIVDSNFTGVFHFPVINSSFAWCYPHEICQYQFCLIKTADRFLFNQILDILLFKMASTRVKIVRSLYEDGGEGSPSNLVKFKGQDFEQLKEALLNQEKISEDEAFPADLNSPGKLEDLTQEQLSEVEWLRPHESQLIHDLK